jgi:hypothetical protein
MSRGARAKTSRPKKLEQFLDALIDRREFRTHREIAAEIGTTDHGLSQCLYDPRRRLSVEQCLRLARKIGAHPMVVLRIAGRHETANVLDELWPQKRDLVALTGREREVIQQWRSTTLDDQGHLWALLRRCADLGRVRTDGRAATARRGLRACPPPPTLATR